MRLSIALLTLLTISATPQANACCLTDWLFGRTAGPYAAGYAPYGYSAVPVGGAIPVSGAYAASYAPYGAAYSSYSLPTQPISTSVLPPITATTPAFGSGAYQVQRPTYFDNPSVYTGQPVTTLRGTASATNFGAGNLYPAYRTGYSSNFASPVSPGLPLATNTPTGLPNSAIPATQVAPLFAPTPPRQGGLSRFFGRLLGTNYRSSYYRAPITYYRPVTSVDPISGSTVTVQQPCSSYVQQLQRSPYSSLQVGQPGFAQPSTCQTAPTAGYAPYGQSLQYGPNAYAGASSNTIGQVGAVGTTPGQFTVPIPSTAPSTGYGPGYTPNTVPLTGVPGGSSPATAFPPTTTPSFGPAAAAPRGAAEDLSPVDQPRIESNRPAESNYNSPVESDQAPPSYWKLQEAEDSTALSRPSNAPALATNRDPVSLQQQRTLTDARPIEAPTDYVSPFRKPSVDPQAPSNRPRWMTEALESFEAPQLPARSDDAGATSVSNRVSIPVRDAALVRGRTVQRQLTPRASIVRDSNWKAAR